MTPEVRKLKNKLTRVISKAGLSWVTYGSIVDYAETLPMGLETACWMFDRVSKKEKILFHKKILTEWPVPLLVIVLRHEFMHKAMYRQIKGATNMALVNFALDAAINKILFLSQPKNMVKLARLLFPDTSKEMAQYRLGITCVMNPSVSTTERNMLDSRLKKIFDDIYTTEKEEETTTDSGNFMRIKKEVTCVDVLDCPYIFNKNVPDPLTLYNKLASLLTPEQKKQVQEMYSWMKGGGRGGMGEDDKNKSKGKSENKDDKEKENKEENKKEEEKQEDNTDENKDKGSTGDDSSEPQESEGQGSQGDQPEEAEGIGNDEQEQPGDINPEEFGRRILLRGGEDNNRANDKKTQDNEMTALQRVLAENYSVHVNLRAYFEKYVYPKQDAGTRGLNDFIAKWQTEKQIESAINTIYNEIKNRTSIDPLPIDLTRTGFELVVLDVCGPDQIPLYFNEQKQGAKKKICCYFDTSPSMHAFIPYMVSIADFFNSCDECEIAGGKFDGRYCFSEKVQGIKDWDAFIKGEVHGGCGTSFEIVVKHANERISEDEVDIVVVFTDGLSGVSQPTIDKFNQTNKKCYTIYFTDPKTSYYYGHQRYHEQRNKQTDMHSDLDKLNGDNFTIFVDTSNKDD